MRLRLDPSPFETTPPPVEEGRYRPVSFWQQTVSVSPGAPLGEDLECDVAIVGGGYTGLSTAIELTKARPELDVVLLERAVVGHGASGRNGGFAMPLLGWSLEYVADRWGEERARRAYGAMYDAVDHLVGLVREHRIDCDLEQTGYLLLGTSPASARRVAQEADMGRRLGFGYELLEGGALEQHVRSEAFINGCYDPHTAILNPAKLARGLKDVAEGLGVRVFEQSPLEELQDGDPVVLRTGRATVRARAAVLAVNGYGGALGWMPRRILPVHTFVVLTEPLRAEQLEAIGWGERRTSLETSRNFIHYFRLTADDRILLGGEDANLYWRGRYRDTDEATFARLEARLKQLLPPLQDVKITHRWGGVLGVTLDMFPSFGAAGARGNVFHGGGYSGHGVALATGAGRILAPPVLARLGLEATGLSDAEQASPVPFGRKPPPLPPDPLLYVGMQAYRAALHLQDRLQGA